MLKQYEEHIRLLKEQLNGINSKGNELSNDNSNNNNKYSNNNTNFDVERNNYENFIKEKDQMLVQSNIEKEKLLLKVQELEKEMERKYVNSFILIT